MPSLPTNQATIAVDREHEQRRDPVDLSILCLANKTVGLTTFAEATVVHRSFSGGGSRTLPEQNDLNADFW